MAELEAREREVFEDLQDPRESKVNKETMVWQERRARSGHRDLRDCLGLLEQTWVHVLYCADL